MKSKIIITGPKPSDVHIIIDDKILKGIQSLKFVHNKDNILPTINIQFSFLEHSEIEDFSKYNKVLEIEYNFLNKTHKTIIKYNGVQLGAVEELVLLANASDFNHICTVKVNKIFLDMDARMRTIVNYFPEWIKVI